MKKRILLIDDEPGVTRMMRRNLEATNRFEVQELNDATQAVATALQFRPDLLICDVMMPEMDGGAVAAAFAETPQLARVPIIFLTAIVGKQEAEPTGSMIGSHVFLAKPVKHDDLLACIANQLGDW